MKIRNHSEVRGFTLIELLVVISIIALLVSILLPALNRARQQAKLVVCASNQHQMLLGIMEYVTDYQKLMPCTNARIISGKVSWTTPVHLNYHTGNFPGTQPINGGSVGGFLAPYLPQAEVFSCPLSKLDTERHCTDRVNGGQETYNELYLTANNYWLKCSYFLLWNYGGYDNDTMDNPPFRGPGYKNTKNTLLTCDVLLWNDVNYGPGEWLSAHPMKGGSPPRDVNLVEGDDSPHPYYRKQDNEGTEIPNVTYNAGYMDGRVDRYNVPDESYAKKSSESSYGLIYLPQAWR